MTLTQYTAYLNRLALLPNVLPGLHIHVRIMDLRPGFGRVDALVEPVSGQGSSWINVNRLTLTEDTANG
jgi:hypothetical protein